MAAPCCEEMPTSPQKATMCCIGMFIGTQQQNTAAISAAMATFGERPTTFASRRSACAWATDAATAGGDRRNSAESSVTATSAKAA